MASARTLAKIQPQSPRPLDRRRIPSPITVVLLIVLAMPMTVLVAIAPAHASAAGKAVTVSGRTCRVYAQNPHATYDSAGRRIVNSKLRFGYCSASVSSITYHGQLQKCSHQSWGCLWSTVASAGPANIVAGHTGEMTRYASKSCVNGHYRLAARITVYVGGSSRTSPWDYSGAVDVHC
jgi:hypothetical protein